MHHPHPRVNGFPKPETHCERRRLAAEGQYAIDVCRCGAIHLTVGPLTIRLEENAYRELASTISAGATELDNRRVRVH
jgi:hypothetical protein